MNYIVINLSVIKHSSKMLKKFYKDKLFKLPKP
jgi:hypothetical protein